ncbi:hypothetical protein Nepgr_013126 [Nepenthes gracilis]|uniref:Uncharacterized protein n=1 Tax=Nepenthes gracilis TaxID=150966 RepID=A0AAD3SGX3_NEPGR|nr:hypothetical protein Nepgr_013126 [Nepenthes gracilis]
MENVSVGRCLWEDVKFFWVVEFGLLAGCIGLLNSRLRRYGTSYEPDCTLRMGGLRAGSLPITSSDKQYKAELIRNQAELKCLASKVPRVASDRFHKAQWHRHAAINCFSALTMRSTEWSS